MRPESLAALARIQRWELNQLRQQVAELERLRDDILYRDGELQESLKRERAIAIEMGSHEGFARYAHVVREQRERLAHSLADIEGQLAEKADQIAAVFQDVKRYETALERMKARERVEAERREQLVLDDIGLEAYRRSGAAG
ncbi:MAG TPA: flagellar FliJ family protein [Alphaproteobacteria bacterium]|nr:flagellar FliJ family protein [Alphaproteobacteria bacterium]